MITYIFSSWVHLLPMVILVKTYLHPASHLPRDFSWNSGMTRMTGRRLGYGEVSYTLQHLFRNWWVRWAVLTRWIGAFSKNHHANAPIHVSHDEREFVIHCFIIPQPSSWIWHCSVHSVKIVKWSLIWAAGDRSYWYGVVCIMLLLTSNY